jgi:hypothetical protein
MTRGHLDGLVSAGFFEGWAYDEASPAKPSLVSIVDDDGAEVAAGFAHLFRADLAQANLGLGWCAFQLRTNDVISRLRKAAFRLIERNTGRLLHETSAIKYHEAGDRLLNSVADVAGLDPTCIRSVEELYGCHQLFNDFIKSRGVETFVRTAYVYILARPADPEGLSHYGKLIRRGAISPFMMLQTLSESQEFQSRPRLLAAPNVTGFPFADD